MSIAKNTFLNWVEISASALKHNIGMFRQIIGRKIIFGVSVKSNAYGHGLIPASKTFLAGGADWLCVNSLYEARILRKAGIKSPIYIMGYVLESDLEEAIALNCRLVVYNKKTVAAAGKIAQQLKKKANIHIKVETGNYRQGILASELLSFITYAKKFPFIEIEGIASHFSNIEDVNPYKNEYPRFQLKNFHAALLLLEKHGIKIPLQHCANSAATLLFPETHFNMVRTGIAAYGMWPSKEIREAAKRAKKGITLKPALNWKTRIAQIKEVPAGAYVGYGCTYQTKRKTRLAILPVGYYDGYDRGFSNRSYVLINGKRAPVRGRVCMNIIMADVTNIPEARVEDPVTLLGGSLTAEYLGDLIGTINYEITTRIHEGIPRIIV